MPGGYPLPACSFFHACQLPGTFAGALNINNSPMLTIWAGWLLDPDEPVLLLLDSDCKINEAG